MSLGWLLLILAFQAEVSGPAPRAPSLFSPRPQFDAGPVWSGKPLAHRFVFLNRGADSVEITSVKEGCGCLRSHLEKHVLEPGEAGSLLLEANTLPQPEGPQAWTVRVRYRSAGAPPEAEQELRLIVRAQVRSEVSVRPASIQLRCTGRVRHSITFLDRRPQPLSIVSLRTSHPALRAHLGLATSSPSGALRQPIELEVLPTYPEGEHQEMVHLLTDDPDYRDLRIPVTVSKSAPQTVRLAPESLTFRAEPGRSIASRLVRLRSGMGQPVVIDRVEADHPSLTFRWAQGPGPDSTLRVSLDPQQVRKPGFRDEIRIHLRSPSGQTLTLPVSCLCSDDRQP
jgi:hypothetical protein